MKKYASTFAETILKTLADTREKSYIKTETYLAQRGVENPGDYYEWLLENE